MAVLAAGLGAALLPGGGVHAAQYTVVAGGAFGTTVTATAFKAQGCPVDFLSNPLNGYDAQVVDAAPFFGRWNANINWSTPAPSDGQYIISVVNGSCGNTIGVIRANGTSGGMNIPVPPGSRFIIFESISRAATTLNVS